MRTRTRREPISQFRSPNRRTRAPHMGGGAVPRGGVCFTQNIFFYLVLFWVLWPHWQTERDTKTRTSEHSNGSRDRGGGFFVYFFFSFFLWKGGGTGDSTIVPPKFKKYIFLFLPFFTFAPLPLILIITCCLRVCASV